MTWSYRIILHDGAEHPWIGLHEVYYEDGRVTAWTLDPIRFCCGADEGPEGISGSLKMALYSATKNAMLIESEMVPSALQMEAPARRHDIDAVRGLEKP